MKARPQLIAAVCLFAVIVFACRSGVLISGAYAMGLLVPPEKVLAARGAIMTADGSVLAQSERHNGKYVRRYPFGEAAAAVTGYLDPVLGRAGLEMTQDAQLAGRPNAPPPLTPITRWFEGRKTGADLKVTIDGRLQKAAWRAMAGRKGAIVALDPHTGAVLAMVSSPSFDPNQINKDWARLAGDKNRPLQNKATQVLYRPASTFKIITTAAALDSKMMRPETTFYKNVRVVVDPQGMRTFPDRRAGSVSLRWAFAQSTNSIFNQIGLKLGTVRLVKQAEAFGFNDSPPFDLPVARSTIPAGTNLRGSALASVAAGMGETKATTVQMALVAASVASGGRVPQPYLIDESTDSGKHSLFIHRHLTWRQALNPQVARTLRSLMEEVVSTGTGTAAQIPGVRVAGKTGTIRSEFDSSHLAWFIGFAPAQKPEMAIAVVIEDGANGGRIAAPAASAVFRAAQSAAILNKFGPSRR